MGVSIAEYLGQRTDVDNPVIEPVKEVRNCPFTHNNTCKKLKSHNPPVCSVRKPDGTLWIVCSDRLCATKKNMPLCQHQSDILLDIGKHIFSEEITKNELCVKREQRLRVVEKTENERATDYNADYIISTRDGRTPFSGPDRLVLEMQGGGETSNTGKLTKHIGNWEKDENRTNEFLRRPTEASTLETNAWRRQQEQFIVKGNIAMKTWKGYGIAFCMGTVLYDYLMNKLSDANLPDLKQYNWTLALLAVKEDTSEKAVFGPIPLIIDESRILYTNYQTFVQALINQGLPSISAFKGRFIDLNNNAVEIE